MANKLSKYHNHPGIGNGAVEIGGLWYYLPLGFVIYRGGSAVNNSIRYFERVTPGKHISIESIYTTPQEFDRHYHELLEKVKTLYGLYARGGSRGRTGCRIGDLSWLKGYSSLEELIEVLETRMGEHASFTNKQITRMVK